MQDEINYRVVMLAIQMGKSGARLTERAFRTAIRKLMEFDDRMHEVEGDGIKHGKQTMKELMDQNAGVSNIEITNNNIGSFERVARKYHIDFALKKDKTMDPPRYLVFFKGRDADVMTAAFKEYSQKEMRHMQREKEEQEKTARRRHRHRVRNRNREIER